MAPPVRRGRLAPILLLFPGEARRGATLDSRGGSVGQTPSTMHSDAAALESIASGLSLLTERLVGIADRRREDPDDELVLQLDDLERTFVGAARRLERLIRSLD